MRLAESATVSDFERRRFSESPYFLVYLSFHIGVHMTLIWTVPEQLFFSHERMRLTKSAIVSNFERLKPPCVGVAADLAIRLFFNFANNPS